MQTPTPDSYRGIYCGDGAGIKYAEEVNKVIERIHIEGKQVGYIIQRRVYREIFMVMLYVIRFRVLWLRHFLVVLDRYSCLRDISSKSSS